MHQRIMSCTGKEGDSGMLPGPLLLSPPPSLVLVGYPYVPSVSPSATPSPSTGYSIAIVAVILIATTILTCAIVVLRRRSLRRWLSCSSFSCRRGSSPMASSSSSSAESEMKCAAAGVVGAWPRVSASFPKDAEESVSGLEALVPSAPPLPEVEKVILDLLSQPPVPLRPGSSMFCCICTQDFLPTDMILALPVCLHKFHQSCIVTWIRSATPSRCPFCYASITIPCPAKTSRASTFSSDEYDIEAQMMAVPAPPGEEVAEAVGSSRGWLRSSLDRLSGSWMRCFSNCTTAVVVPVSSRRATGSWRLDTIGHLNIGSYGIQTQLQSDQEEAEAVEGSRGWLHSYLATLSDTWSGRSDSQSTAMVLPVSTRHTTGSLSLGSSDLSSADSWSGSWDPEAAVQRTSVFDHARWLLKTKVEVSSSSPK